MLPGLPERARMEAPDGPGGREDPPRAPTHKTKAILKNLKRRCFGVLGVLPHEGRHGLEMRVLRVF